MSDKNEKYKAELESILNRVSPRTRTLLEDAILTALIASDMSLTKIIDKHGDLIIPAITRLQIRATATGRRIAKQLEQKGPGRSRNQRRRLLYQMIEKALKAGMNISQTARLCKTSRITVAKVAKKLAEQRPN